MRRYLRKNNNKYDNMNKSVFIAIIIAALAVFWIFTGLFFGESSSEDSLGQKEEKTLLEATEGDIPKVRVRDLTSQPMEDVIEITGRTRASRQVYLKSETDGQVVSVLVEKGAIVKKGQLLVKLAMQDRSARVLEAEQLLSQRNIQYKASKELAEKGFNSRVRLAESRAQLETARVQLKRARIELSNIRVKAPFDGVVNNQMVEIGDYVSKGTSLFDVVDLDPIEISGFLTEKQITHAHEGMLVEAELLNGEEVNGAISFIAPVASVETRTFEMEITFSNEAYKIKEGLTAKIKIPVREMNAYKISPSILSLTDSGAVGVKIVNADNRVEFKEIRLLKDTPEHLWISGLPETVRIITVGQEFVVSGQEVEPVLEEGSSAQ